MNKLEDAIAKIWDRSSILWCFYDPAEAAETKTIEIRLNGSPEQAATFEPPAGWTLHRVQWGDTFFIRRRQPMSEARIEGMLCEMLEFAVEHRMQVQSWQTGPGLTEDGFHP